MKLNDYSGDSYHSADPPANVYQLQINTITQGILMKLRLDGTMFLSQLLFGFIVLCTGTIFIMPVHCVLAEAATEFTVANGELSLAAPAGWKQVQPRSRIVETEFAIKPVKPDNQPGRMTSMGAGGSIEANIARWYSQFSQPDGTSTKDKAGLKTLRIAGCKVTCVDVSGTYKDMPGGPFAGGQSIDRPNYRMLAAIIETTDKGNYFIKFYGPAATVEASADGFKKMIEGMVSTN